MPTKVEKDAVTGRETTGHEWDGIRELNTPLPRWWLYVFWATVVWSAIYIVLYPAVPGITGYTKGILGYSQREELNERLLEARAAQSAYLGRIDEASLQQIAGDPDLSAFAMAGGRAMFADNCVPCHGQGGAGQFGYPSVADDAWLWGGTLEEIHTTLLYGVRSGDEQARFSEMPAFGADNLLTREQIGEIADYVLALAAGNADAPGRQLFLDNCAACHGEHGRGLREFGAPRLNDRIWLYGGTREQVVRQIAQPRHGVMPGWSGRLDDAALKMLAVYVHALGGGE